MDLRDPAVGLFGRFEALALQVLFRHRQGGIGVLTVSDVHRRAGTGSYESIRRALRRLETLGIVWSQELPAGIVYRLNQDHLGYEVLEAAMAIPGRLVEDVRARLEQWPRRIDCAAIVGSFARGWYWEPRAKPAFEPEEGAESETVDLLMVYAGAGRDVARDVRRGAGRDVARDVDRDAVRDAARAAAHDAAREPGHERRLHEATGIAVRALEDAVCAWTGNRLIVHEFEETDFKDAVDSGRSPEILDEYRRASVALIGSTPFAYRWRRNGVAHREWGDAIRRAASDPGDPAVRPRTG